MRRYVLQPLIFILMVVIIVGGGWLGIRSMDYILPSGTDGVSFYPIDTLTDENFQAPLSSKPLPPFTSEGFPAQAVSVANSEAYAEYLDLLRMAVISHSTMSPALSEILISFLESYKIMEKGENSAIILDIRTYKDQEGTWVLYQSTITAQSMKYQLRMAFHSVDGVRLIQLLPVSEGSMLSPDGALLQRAAEECTVFLEALTQEYEIAEEKGRKREVELYGLSDGTIFPLKLPVAESADIPQRTVIAGTQCLVYYPAADGGQIVVVYDFVGMHISGIAYAPEGGL